MINNVNNFLNLISWKDILTIDCNNIITWITAMGSMYKMKLSSFFLLDENLEKFYELHKIKIWKSIEKFKKDIIKGVSEKWEKYIIEIINTY